MPNQVHRINSEQLAYWYLRLNGFFTINNFVVHPDEGANQETDVDVLGVRFPYRAENLIEPMQDDVLFTRFTDKTLIAITEVKTSKIMLNGPWKLPERGNMLRLVKAIGAFRSDTETVAEALYRHGYFENSDYRISIVCIGGEKNVDVLESYPEVPQIIWSDIFKFIFERFENYRRQKASHKQWDRVGKLLWSTSKRCRDALTFQSHFTLENTD